MSANAAPRTLLKHAGTNGASANAAFVSGFDVHLHENTVLAQRCAAPVSGFGHIYMKRYIGGSNSGTSANAAPVIGFGVHLRETLSSRRCKRSVCKCCTCCPCQRIWRTPTRNIVLGQKPTKCRQMPHLSTDLVYTDVTHFA